MVARSPTKRHEKEPLLKPSPRKQKQKKTRDHDEHQPRKKPCQNHPETAKEIKEKIRMSDVINDLGLDLLID